MVNATSYSLPVAWGTTVGLVSQPILPQNPSRQALIFVNTSLSASVAICPALVNAGVNGVYLGLAAGVAAINGASSITLAPGDKFIIDTMNVTTAWNGIGSAAGAQITMLES
jgi:hypothetical protein